MRKIKASYIIEVEWSEQKKGAFLTSQIIRDKLFMPLQELWLTRVIDKAHIEQTDENTSLARTNIKGKRKGTKIKQKK